jgi:N-acetyl-alpha-D-muramate 1-phosphate uridylyltransferase
LKALILAAGLGTRLMPLTVNTPKALVKVNGTTLLELAINKLLMSGISEIIVNVHHHSRKVIEFLEQNPFPAARIAISDESGELLDTGGAIRKARWFLDGEEPFLVHNVDVISDINLNALLREHFKRDGLATISVGERLTKRYFLFDSSLKLVGWADTSRDIIRWADKPVKSPKALAFSGIHIISPKIFGLLDDKDRFSIIDTYIRLAKSDNIFGYLQPGQVWFDVGKPDQLSVASGFLKDHPEFYTKP